MTKIAKIASAVTGAKPYDQGAGPLFIVGSGRSGSTLLRMILASHSRISIPPETWYLEELVTKLPLERPLDRAELERAVKIMTGHYRWPDLNFDADEFRRTAMELREPTLRNVIGLVYLKIMQREGKCRWGDKTPGYIKVVDRLAELYPGAKFIHILRDGRDVARSFQSVGWYSSWLYKNTEEWTEAADLARHWQASEIRSKIHRVRYEDLVLDMERTVRGVCDFLGEEYEPQMLSWQQKVGQLVPEREMRAHAKLERPPQNSDVARWQREMTSVEILVAEAFMGNNLSHFGYSVRYGPAWAPLLAATRFYCKTVLPAVSFLGKAGGFVLKRIGVRQLPGQVSPKQAKSTRHHA